MFNQTTVIGHVGNDCQTKTLEGGRVVTQFSVAHTESWKDNRGEKMERTVWFNCSYFTASTPGVAAYITKGALVCVTGKVSVRAYLDGRNQPAASLDLNIDKVGLLGSRRDNERNTSPAPNPENGNDATTATTSPAADGDDLPF